MPENIIIFSKSKIENRKREMVGGGEYWWETDLWRTARLCARPPRSKEFAVPRRGTIISGSYGDGIGHGICIILLRYRP